MKQLLPMLLFGFSSVFALRAMAGGCHLESVSSETEFASYYIADKVRAKVKKLEAEIARQGEELKVVIISRKGTRMDDFLPVKDNPTQPLYRYLDQLAKMSKSQEQGSKRVPERYIDNRRLKYTHLGFLLKKSNIKGNETAGDFSSVIHLLANCDECAERYGDSEIFHELLPKFFWDKAERDKERTEEVMLMVPQGEFQTRLYNVLTKRVLPGRVSGPGKKDAVAQRLHTANYNAISVPFLRPGEFPYQIYDQNSNQWPLEAMAAAQVNFGQVTRRTQAQDVLRELGYRPSIVQPDSFKTNMACGNVDGLFNLGLFYDATNLIDCDNQIHQKSGLYQVISVDSIKKYLLRTGMVAGSMIREVTLTSDEVNRHVDYKMANRTDLQIKIREAIRVGSERYKEIQCQKKGKPKTSVHESSHNIGFGDY